MDADRGEAFTVRVEEVIDKIIREIHRSQNIHFLISIGTTAVIFVALLLIRWYDMSTLLTRIDAVKHVNTNSVNVQRESTAVDLAREILRKDGKVD